MIRPKKKPCLCVLYWGTKECKIRKRNFSLLWNTQFRKILFWQEKPYQGSKECIVCGPEDVKSTQASELLWTTETWYYNFKEENNILAIISKLPMLLICLN